MPDLTGPGFATEFDIDVPTLEAPAVLGHGNDSAIRVVDGFARGVGIVGRFTSSPGMFAFKVAAHGMPVRVDVLLRVDGTSSNWWEQRLPSGTTVINPDGVRLVLVRSQGVPRAAALLATPSRHGRRPSRAWVSFELTPEELPDDGLLMLEIEDGSIPAASWGSRLASHPTVGIAVIRAEVTPLGRPATARRGAAMRFDAAAAARQGIVSTGDLPEIDGVGDRQLSAGTFVINVPVPHLTGATSGEIGIRVKAVRGSRVEKVLPSSLARVITAGPVGRARVRADRMRKQLVPLRAAAVREMRKELGLNRLAALVERAALVRVTTPDNLLGKLLAARLVRVHAVSVRDGSPVEARWNANDLELIVTAESGCPVLISLGVDASLSASLLEGRPLHWQLNGVTFNDEKGRQPLTDRRS